jgi:hypothetical protein
VFEKMAKPLRRRQYGKRVNPWEVKSGHMKTHGEKKSYATKEITYDHQEMCLLSHRPLYDSSGELGLYVFQSDELENREGMVVLGKSVMRTWPF